jgi:Rod binding domain-containing protein
MQKKPTTNAATSSPIWNAAQPRPPTITKDDDKKLRQAFDQFVGETFFSQMLSSMRKTLGKPAYFHGGRAEEIFQGQLDQILAQEMTEASASQFTGPMFELFKLNRH